MKIIQVQSLPIKNVLENLASELGTTMESDCGMYLVRIPQQHGSGFIHGVSFPNGLAWLQYDCKFNEAVEIRFTVNEVHPLKLLYNLSDRFVHSFEGEDQMHEAERFRNLIVASKNHNGHILRFRAKRVIKLNSVEIDRERFVNDMTCDIDSLNTDLKEALLDIKAEKQHYFEGPYTLRIANVFQAIDSYTYKKFICKMLMASKTFEIIALQMLDYSVEKNQNPMADSDYQLAQNIDVLLTQNFKKHGSVRALSTKLKVSEPKLQKFFKEHYDVTGNEYLKKKRMDLIVDLLEETSLSIGDIAKLVGIDSPSYLSKLFREKFDIAPNQYRNNSTGKD